MKKIKPILFSTPMVQAILYGRKTQTRRTIKPQPQTAQHGKVLYKDRELTINSLVNHAPIQKGDILWVRETFKLNNPYGTPEYSYKTDWDTYNTGLKLKWKPSIFMPKSAARIFLKVRNVKAERLQEISDEDCVKEGIIPLAMSAMQLSEFGQLYFDYTKPTQIFNDGIQPFWSFNSLWCTINGAESWESNPFVWVYEFERIEKPENFM